MALVVTTMNTLVIFLIDLVGSQWPTPEPPAALTKTTLKKLKVVIKFTTARRCSSFALAHWRALLPLQEHGCNNVEQQAQQRFSNYEAIMRHKLLPYVNERK